MAIDTDFIKHNPIYHMKEEFFYDEFLFGMF